MSCRIFLVRHGETAWNKEMRFQGHKDIPLSETGKRQAEALAGRLSEQKISAVYSSDLSRAVETASRIAALQHLDIITLPALREMNFGRWEGSNVKEIREKYGDLIQRWWAAPLHINTPDGECLADLAARVVPAVRKITERHEGEQVAVVCHGGPVRCLVATVLKMDLNYYWKIRQGNCALNIIDFESADNGILSLLNDRSHLGGDLEMPKGYK